MCHVKIGASFLFLGALTKAHSTKIGARSSSRYIIHKWSGEARSPKSERAPGVPIFGVRTFNALIKTESLIGFEPTTIPFNEQFPDQFSTSAAFFSW